jgi:hypothetical protein
MQDSHRIRQKTKILIKSYTTVLELEINTCTPGKVEAHFFA